MLGILARCAAAAFLALAPLSLSAEALEPPALSEYGKLPEISHVTLSPSGERIAYIGSDGSRPVLYAMEGFTPFQAIAVNDLKIRSIRWIGEDRLLVITSQTEDLGSNFTTDKAEMYVGRVIPLAEGASGGLVFANEIGLLDTIVGTYGFRTIDGRHYGYFGAIQLERERAIGRRVASYGFRHGRPYLYRVDLETLEAERVAVAAAQDEEKDWLIGVDGGIAFELRIDRNNGKWNLRNARKEIIARGENPNGSVSLVGLGFDGSSAILVSRGSDASEWLEIPADGGAPQPFLENQPFERLFFDRASGSLMGYVVGEGEDERNVFADPELAGKADRVREAFAQFNANIHDWTGDLDNLVVRTSGNRDSGTYYKVDVPGSRAEAFAFMRTAIGPEQVGAISTFEYTAGDGLELDGILTTPPGAEASDLPLVLLPHGGPHSADYDNFDWWAQAFASRGYAVFQPNFRGSTHRDGAFMRLGYGEWGRKMQTDKSDGVAALAEAGVIDPNRVCIVGASYGGYAALAGVTIQQGLYRCAVAVAPVSDLRDMYQEDYRAVGRDRTTRTSLRQRLGDSDQWSAHSPLKLAERADAPILLIHGRDDTVVPFSHSAKMADALKDEGKPHELITLDGEDHWLSLEKTRRQMLTEAVAFVERHNPPD